MASGENVTLPRRADAADREALPRALPIG